MLDVAVTKRLDATLIEVAFSSSRRVTALFGPSGSGKTSVINMIAGLLRPERGKVIVSGATLFDKDRGVWVPTHKRRVGYVFQEARLFPHLTVKSNLAYGRWMNGIKRDADEEARIFEMLNIGHLLGRRPSHLSGGERQRVAIGRALLSKPQLLLLDEPLASLDEDRKGEILPYLERLRDEANLPMVYVSHDSDEVRRMADTVVHLARGRVVKVIENGRGQNGGK